MPIHLTVRCTYPGTSIEPSEITIQPLGLGDTAEEVDQAFRLLLLTQPIFYVDAVGEPAIPFNSETVREVRVWEE